MVLAFGLACAGRPPPPPPPVPTEASAEAEAPAEPAPAEAPAEEAAGDPQVVAGAGPTSGDINGEAKAALATAIQESAGTLKECYEPLLITNSHLAGTVEVGIMLSHGRITRAKIASNATGDDILGKCIVEKVKLWTLPDNASGNVQWPFEFSRGE